MQLINKGAEETAVPPPLSDREFVILEKNFFQKCKIGQNWGYPFWGIWGAQFLKL